MATAKKKSSSKTTASGGATTPKSSSTDTQVKRATADPVPAVEENRDAFKSTAADTSDRERPGIDPGLSADNVNSTYQEVNDRFPPDTGNQVEETPGKPSPAKD